jgi:hypothetical protein
MRPTVTPSLRACALTRVADLVIGRPMDWLQFMGVPERLKVIKRKGYHEEPEGRAGPKPGKRCIEIGTRGRDDEVCDYGFVLTVFVVASSEGVPCPATKKLWSYMLRYMRPAISAALGPKVGRPPSRKITTTTRPMLVFA